jgi:hypothetical protein
MTLLCGRRNGPRDLQQHLPFLGTDMTIHFITACRASYDLPISLYDRRNSLYDRTHTSATPRPLLRLTLLNECSFSIIVAYSPGQILEFQGEHLAQS